MKRIIICCDGTWNAPDKTENGIPVATNVVKIAEVVRPVDRSGIMQRVYYDPGVGTSGGVLKRSFEGMTGSGLSRNLKEAYRFLIENHIPGDELFFFGFSRGAFTVRSLAGLIRNCGILRSNSTELVDRAYELYRSRSAASHPTEREATLFRSTYAVSDITPIKFIGVWDTVGALGNPLLMNGILSQRHRFHDTNLSSTVEHAYQALAIDETRRHFKAELWHSQGKASSQTLRQLWFAGVHSNIGGGYPSTGLSDIALQWMREMAGNCDLELKATSMQPEPLSPREESRTGPYKLVPKFDRPIAVPVAGNGATGESLHPSVLVRYAGNPDYRPRNLEDYFRRNPQSRLG